MDEVFSLLTSLVGSTTERDSSRASTVRELLSQSLIESDFIDEDSLGRIQKAVNRTTECIHVTANEPALGLYRVDEHVRRSLPQLVERKKDLRATCLRVEGMTYDLNYTRQAAQSLRQLTIFGDVHRQLLYAIRLKGDIDRSSGRGVRVEAMNEFTVREQELQSAETFVAPPDDQTATGFIRARSLSTRSVVSGPGTGTTTPYGDGGRSRSGSQTQNPQGDLEESAVVESVTIAADESESVASTGDYPGIYTGTGPKLKKKTTKKKASTASSTKTRADGEIQFKSFD